MAEDRRASVPDLPARTATFENAYLLPAQARQHRPILSFCTFCYVDRGFL